MERSCNRNESNRFALSTQPPIDRNTKMLKYTRMRGKKSIPKPYLSLDVPKSRHSHVPYLSNEYGSKPKNGYHLLSSHRLFLFIHSSVVVVVAVANSLWGFFRLVLSQQLYSSFGTLKIHRVNAVCST